MPASVQQQEYLRLCDAEFDAVHDPDDHRIWTPLRMHTHNIRHRRNQPRYAMAKVTWLTEDPSWIPIDTLRRENPFLVIDYVMCKPVLMKALDFKWVLDYVKDEDKLQQVAQAFKATTTERWNDNHGSSLVSKSHTASTMQPLQLDKRNGNTLWADAIAKEYGQQGLQDISATTFRGGP
jgi:hypothetical protein